MQIQFVLNFVNLVTLVRQKYRLNVQQSGKKTNKKKRNWNRSFQL